MKTLHVLAWVFAFLSFFLIFEELILKLKLVLRPQVNWERSLLIVRNVREKLESGYLPNSEDWESLKRMEPPWGLLSYENISELRQGGIPVVPSLVRFEKMISEQNKADQESRAKSAQAWGQAVVCGAIVPLVSVALYFLVPGLNQRGLVWWGLALFSLLLDAVAMIWMMGLAESARWAGLHADRRHWWPSVTCFGERLLGLLRSGNPADLAWSKAIPQLGFQSQDLMRFWGPDLWSESKNQDVRLEPSARALVRHGESIRKAIQISIYEGRGCYERIEAAVESLRIELQSEVERQIQLLSTRSLKPLFLCVAPSVFILLISSFALSWEKLVF